MCYLCFNSSPFSPVNGASPLQRKRERILEIKEILRSADAEDERCTYGDTVVEALKREQYRLSREL